MPELPEVETVRRMLEGQVLGRVIRDLRLSRKRLREPIPSGLPSRVRGKRIESVDRHGKYLLIHLDGGPVLLSHLGMSGRWLFDAGPPPERLPHVHARITFEDGTGLRFQDPRRFGLLRPVRDGRDPALAALGPDPLKSPPAPESLAERSRGRKVGIKLLLMDQKVLAGIGNIYASEILHRAGVHPGRAAGRVRADEWGRISIETSAVLQEAVSRMGTTFSAYRTLWGEPGSFGDQLRVYDRAGEPCRKCGTSIRRMVQGQRSTFWCPKCQTNRAGRPSRRSPSHV